MGIAEDDVAKVRAQTDIVQLVSEHAALRKQGTRWVGLCPFHAEKTPSFSVNPEAGLFYCFGCQAKGDAITFVREVQHLDFVAAVEALASRTGITLHYDSTRESGERKRRQVLVEAMNAAVDWYHQRLLTSEDARAARGYLRSRGYDGEVVRRYRIGWAPDGWDVLCRSAGLAADVLRETGLGFVNSRNRLQDAFRARVLFPIFDVRGDAVAIGGRVLPGSADPAKYKNSPATAIYDKSETLYGLNWAKASIVERGEVVVCEGYTDVIGLAQVGVTHAVATCGTALTDRHLVTLKNFARRIVLAFDADAAGQGAAARFYEWERRHELDVAVAALPAGADPGELARTKPELLRSAIAEAVPFLQFRVNRLLDGADLRTVEGRARTAEAAMAMIAEHPSELVRDQYVMQVADRTRVDPDRLRGGIRGRSAAPPPPTARRRERHDSPSLNALRLAVHRPELVADVLDQVLFVDPVELAAFRALADAPTLHEAIADADPEAAELLSRLAVEELDDELEADDVLSLLVAELAGKALAELQASARAAADPLEGAETQTWVKLRLEELRERDSRRRALEQLVPFLVLRGEESRA